MEASQTYLTTVTSKFGSDITCLKSQVFSYSGAFSIDEEQGMALSFFGVHKFISSGSLLCLSVHLVLSPKEQKQYS